MILLNFKTRRLELRKNHKEEVINTKKGKVVREVTQKADPGLPIMYMGGEKVKLRTGLAPLTKALLLNLEIKE